MSHGRPAAERPVKPHVPPGRGARRSKLRRAGIGFAFMAPLLAVNILVLAVPAALSIWYSFTDWTGLGPANYVGPANHQRPFGDAEFRAALWHNVLWTASFLTVPMAMGLFGAFLLSRIKRFHMLFRVAYFIPSVVATVISGSIWERLLSPDQGVPHGLSFLKDVNFPGDPRETPVVPRSARPRPPAGTSYNRPTASTIACQPRHHANKVSDRTSHLVTALIGAGDPRVRLAWGRGVLGEEAAGRLPGRRPAHARGSRARGR